MPDKNILVFLIFIAFFSLKTKMMIHLGLKLHNISLNIEDITKNILAEYLDFADFFFKNLAI